MLIVELLNEKLPYHRGSLNLAEWIAKVTGYGTHGNHRRGQQ